jgi:hypothetical protein
MAAETPLNDEAKKLQETVNWMLEAPNNIMSQVEDIAQQAVRSEIAKLEPQPMLYPMGLWDLNSPKYELKVPIHIVVEEWPDNEFIAHWHDVEATGFGEGKAEAVEALQQDIIDLYEDLKDTDDKHLGKRPLKARKVLQAVIKETTS